MLDVVTAPLNFAQALSRLRAIAAATPFQVENEGAPVEVMGILESSGLRFDHLWIMGLHDEALPAAASPHPFLPVSLQQEHGLPHSSAGRELEFSRTLIARLLASAPAVVLSYPETEGDRPLALSPLVADVVWRTPNVARSDDWTARMRTAVTFEEMIDETAPPAHIDATQIGGASLFKDMAACPFRAFAKHRLGARPLEDTELGLSYKDRGNTVHRAMQLIWTELGSHVQLVEIGPAELEALIKRHVETAVARLGPGIGRQLERVRLEKLLAEWLHKERSRAPFRVLKSEEERVVSVSGLQVRTRVDRVDELASGGEIILDYKTGQVKPAAWEGDRPDEPQVPLYCATSERPIAAAAFAIVRTGELAFRGAAENPAVLPELKRMSAQRPAKLADQIAEWKRVLEQLAEDFRDGLARVDPKPDACEHCGLTALCRIRERENGRR
jgi:probable DNA repair protein